MAVGVIVVAAVLAVTTAAGLAWRRRDGRLAPSPRRGRAQVLTRAQVGRDLGSSATLLQFSSSFCTPCRTARQVLADVAAHQPGVAHIEIDVAERMDLVRLLDIRRTPTTFVLGPGGRIAQRASGLPRRDQVIAAVVTAAGPQKPTRRVGSDRRHGRA